MCSKKRGHTPPLDSQQTRLPNRNTQKTTITLKTAFLSQLTVNTPHTYPFTPVYYNGPLTFIFCPKWEVGHLITRSG